MSYLGNQPNSVAFLTDQFSGNGSTVVFTMSVAPAATSSILVNISGITQDPTTYAISGTTLTFSAAPPLGVGNISVRYLGIPASAVATTTYRTVTEFTATANQVTFNVPSYTIGYIDVYRNGIRLGAADFTASNGTTVVLAAGALLGDLIVTESFYVSSVLNAIPSVAGAVNSTYIADNAVGTSKIDTAAVTQSKLAANVAGNGPAFSAYLGSSQSISVNTYTKVQCNTEEFDTNSNYDNTTYRFTPTIAGYYQINGAVYGTGTTMTASVTKIFKNGNPYKQGTVFGANSGANAAGVVNTLVYLNGTTDYVELYCYVGAASGGSFAAASTEYTWFNGYLARAA
jgi:hypothetical protein